MKKYALLFFLVWGNYLTAQTVTIVAEYQLANPIGLYADSNGNNYVGDFGNNRIQKFPPGSNALTVGTTVAGGNGAGNAPNQLDGIENIYVDRAGNIYVTDWRNHRIQKFTAGSTSSTNGTTVAGGNGSGINANQLNYPEGVFVDNSGYIYVADSYNNRIQKFPPASTSDSNGITVAGGNGAGIDSNQLNAPSYVFVDQAGNIYVADALNYRVQKFPAGSTQTTNGVTIAGGNGAGAGANQLGPESIYLDSAGNVYIADEVNGRVLKFPPMSTSATYGTTVAGGNGIGNSLNQMNEPRGMYVDRNGNIYVADQTDNRVQKWGPLAALTAYVSSQDEPCSGLSDGSITINAAGGIPPYEYKIDGAGFQTGNIFSMLNQGIHLVTVRDSISATVSFSDTLTQAAALNLSGTVTNTTGGMNNGAITITVQGSGYSFIWSDSGASTQNRTGLAPGNYSVIVRDSNSCATGTYLVNSSTGINDINTNTAISLYPNPNTGSFILQSTNSIGREYIIYDMIGRIIKQGNITADKQSIELQNVSVGSYTLEVKGSKAIRFTIE